MSEPEVAYACDATSFRPVHAHEVRWLDVEDDFDLLAHFHERRGNAVGGAAEPFTRAAAIRWRDKGFTDAGVMVGGAVVSRAARWTYSDDAWELAGVFTLPPCRGGGLARSVCSFVTEAILQAGRTATCHTDENNVAMRRVIESLGYERIS